MDGWMDEGKETTGLVWPVVSLFLAQRECTAVILF